jgi:16S rRNA (cytosine1402-N4)-methyltransferase
VVAEEYHKPVMLAESIEALNIKEDGIYVDATFGGGGHSKAILEKLNTGKLIAFDQDPDAWNNELTDKNFILIKQNFRFMLNYLKYQNVLPVDGILADLGISSHQIDDPSRGFSTRFENELDMRMSRSGNKSAKKIINEYSADQLQRIFSEYGEVRNAKTLANAIVKARSEKAVETVNDLKKILDALVSGQHIHQYYAQVFQAIRIEVNEELEALKQLLQQSSLVLTKGGRLAVISYHSLEDRLVKNFFNHGTFEGEAEKDVYGNRLNIPFKPVNKKPKTPSAEEIKINQRSRSAKLRVAEKI